MLPRGQNASAFVDGFIDAFGFVGQGCEPVIGGVSVLQDGAQPVTLNLHRFRRTASRYYVRKLADGRYVVRGAKPERRSLGE